MPMTIYKLADVKERPKVVAIRAQTDEVVVACPTIPEARRFSEDVRRAAQRDGMQVKVRGQHTCSVRFTAVT